MVNQNEAQGKIAVLANGKKLFEADLYDFKDNLLKLRDYQLDILKKWEKRLLCIAPTGAGKSAVMVTRAAQNMVEGISTFIIAPKLSIVECFNHTESSSFSVEAGDKPFTLPPKAIQHVNGTGRTDIIVAALKQAGHIPRIIVSGYESFRLAYEKVRTRVDRDNIEVIIDEAHHASVDDDDTEGNGDYSNELGKLIKRLLKDDIAVSAFTATGYRADGGTIVNGDKDKFSVYRRTLKQHHSDGFCPDLNIQFKFYEEARAEEFKKCQSTSEDKLIIGSYGMLINAFSRECDPSRRTLMILPSRMHRPDGGNINAATVAVELEEKLRADHPGIRVLNLGGYVDKYGEHKLVSLNDAEYNDRRKLLQQSRDRDDVDVIISIKVMDEGVDWPHCDVVFMPRVPGSLPLIVQRIGRAMRKKGKPSTSDVYFFELGVIGDDPEVTDALVKTACRLKCLFHGLEFREPFRFFKKSTLRDKLFKADIGKLNDAGEAIQLQAAKLDGHNSAAEILEVIVDEYSDIGVELTPVEAVEVAITSGVIDNSDNLKKALKSFLSRVKTKSNDFKKFLNDEKVKEALAKLTVHGPRTYVELLNGKNSVDIERIIGEWQHEYDSVATKKRQLIELAKQPGSKRPNQKSEDQHDRSLGVVLSSYTCKKSSNYDVEFTTIIKNLRPDWFENTADIKKRRLIKLAKQSCGTRPSSTSTNNDVKTLGRSLVNYTSMTHRLYDAEFTAVIKALKPDWFEDTVQIKKQQLIELAKQPGSKRPSAASTNIDVKLGRALVSYTCKKSSNYDVEFTTIIKNLRPDWFDRSSQKKQLLLEIANDRYSQRPRRKSNSTLERIMGGALIRYTNCNSSTYDAEFTAVMKALKPDWFEDTVQIKKQQLIELAKQPGSKRPSQKSKDQHSRSLGAALSNYTSRASRLYDITFDGEIRDLRPDWFEKGHYITHKEARIAAIKLNINGSKQYPKRYREDPKLPSNPSKFYRNKGWVSWSHFLGKDAK